MREDQISQAPNPVRISVDVQQDARPGRSNRKSTSTKRRARPLGGHFEVGGHHQAEKGHGLRHFSAAEFLLQAERPLHALKAFGRIVKTLFILRYIDDVALRMAIEAQLNQVELANRFTRAVAVGNPREFAYAHQDDQQVAGRATGSSKTPSSAGTISTSRCASDPSDAAQRKELLLASKRTPDVLGHINLLGEYDFSDAS